jgi:Dyp-type peroxidase family
MVELRLADIQAMVVTGYGHLTYSTYMFLHVADGPKARAWLAGIIPEVTTARWDTRPEGRVRRPARALNIAFTAGGLEALGLLEASLRTFPLEFLEGMAEGARSQRLGDTGGSSPQHWEIGGPAVDESGEPDPTRAVHMLLIVRAPTKDEVDALCQAHRLQWESDGGVREIVPAQEGYLPTNGREHFGFADSISQPEIEGSPKKPAPRRSPIRAGEFVLGYPNEYGKLPPTPTVPAVTDTHDNLRGVEHASMVGDSDSQPEKDLGRNGTYLVFRKLQQNVGGFRRYLRDNSTDPAERDLLAAKFVGRWPSGTPLTLAPDHDDLRLAGAPQNNNFGFMDTDPEGYRCPVGAHIRRANPRDSLGGDPQGSVRSVNRHRILRRGVLYGDPLPDGVLEDDGKPRGVLFFCINTDISRQFEFVQQMWIDNPKFAGLYTDRDPLIGSNRDPSISEDQGPWRMTIPRQPVRRRLAELPRFVSVRGGGYFFLPSISALYFLTGIRNPHRQRS